MLRLFCVQCSGLWLYFAVGLDLYSRRVIGWSMKAEMNAQLITDALMMAVWRRGKPEAVMHHSDRGSQYTSEQFQRLLSELGVTCSMSRSGKVWDNLAMESSSLHSRQNAWPVKHFARGMKFRLWFRLQRALLQSRSLALYIGLCQLN